MTPFDRQFDELRAAYPDATYAPSPVGMTITVPGVTLEPADAWNKPATTVRFVAPLGYPQAQPDCFWVDEDLRLRSGALPANTSPNNQLGPTLLWFSWHVSRWSPNNDTLLKYLRVIQTRLHQAT